MNLVIGTINSYNKSQIVLFVNSLRNFNTQCDVALFGSNFDNELIDYAKEKNVKLISSNFNMKRIDLLFRRDNFFNKIHTIIWHLLVFKNIRKYLLSRTTGIMVRRFVHYFYFLESKKEKYKYIFLTDVRDVIWQSDIFSKLDYDGLHIFMEDPSAIIGCKKDNNYKWLNRMFGITQANKLKGKISSCAGTIYGDYKSIIKYLNLLLFYSGKQNAHEYGDDQAIHNYIVHNNLIANTVKHENENCPVLTMCDMPEEKCIANNQGFVVDKNNSPYSILHHYDRYPNLLSESQKRYTD